MKFQFAGLVTAVTFVAVPGLFAFPSSSATLHHSTPANYAFQQQNIIGTVTAIDAAGGKVSVKTDSGGTATFSTNEKTAVRRVPPGQTSLANAETISLGDVKVGDRVLVPGGSMDAQAPVRQVIVMASEAITAKRTQQQTDWQSRGINGRVTAVNTNKREITIQTRGQNGPETLTVIAPASAKVSRYASDSLRSEDALPATLSDIHAGDQVRVLGNPSPDGKSVTADEILSGSIVRAFGTITDINAPNNEVSIKNDQTGQTYTVSLGKRSLVKRLPPEVAQNLAQRRKQSQQRRQAQAESTGVQTENPAGRGNRRGADGGQQRRGFQQLLEDQPSISIADLKKGDALMVTGTQGADASHLTAVSVIAGDAELMQLFQRPQGRRNGNMSPGLPGNVAGGNAQDNEQP
jgi:Cu/Ag efflux protein CusF